MTGFTGSTGFLSELANPITHAIILTDFKNLQEKVESGMDCSD